MAGGRVGLKNLSRLNRGESSSLSLGTKGDRKGRRWPRPPSRPAPQRLRTGKIRAGKKEEVEKKRENLPFLKRKGESTGLFYGPDRLARNSIDGGKIIYLVDTGKLQSLKFPSFWLENTPGKVYGFNYALSRSSKSLQSDAVGCSRPAGALFIRLYPWPRKKFGSKFAESGKRKCAKIFKKPASTVRLCHQKRNRLIEQIFNISPLQL